MVNILILQHTIFLVNFGQFLTLEVKKAGDSCFNVTVFAIFYVQPYIRVQSVK